jgi:hypothetical protein
MNAQRERRVLRPGRSAPEDPSSPGAGDRLVLRRVARLLALWMGIAATLGAAERLVIDLVVPDDAPALPVGDQRPARAILDLAVLLTGVSRTGAPDLATLRVLDAAGQNVPLRWDDEGLANDFETVEGVVGTSTGALTHTRIPNGGLHYNVTPPVLPRGRLVWTHTRRGAGPARYTLEAALRPPGLVSRAPARGWIGDGVARFTSSPPSTTGSSHTRIDVTDWNGDGRPDIVAGENYGKIFVLLNHGTATAPAFGAAEFVTDEAGRALDAGISAAPLVVDWDGDGRRDLLVGTHWNRVLFFRNATGGASPRFSYRGVVTIDGRPLELPHAPVVGRPAGVFARDYYPVMAMADWDGDGRADLIAGGYVTGRIFLFRNRRGRDDGTPRLEPLGPILADGRILNVGDWAAAPSLADVNGDGLLDLVTGNYPMTPESADAAPLRLYLNVGQPGAPEFREVPLPVTGRWPAGRLGSPRLADLNGDGLLDLVVSSHANIFLFLNIGTRTEPRFAVHGDFIRPEQGNSPLGATQLIDWDGDGRVDAVSGYSVRLNRGAPDPFEFGPNVPVLPAGRTIEHPSKIGDDWFHPRFFDFDGDGGHDILFGDWHGHVWLHRQLGVADYDFAGRKLALESGEPIKVGPQGVAVAESFQALQGARTVFTAASFTGDGRTDLVVGDTFGIVRFFKNVRSNADPVFRAVQTIGNLGTRLSVDLIDWNLDGHPDVICGSANGRVRVFLNRPDQPPESRFAAGLDPQLPPIVQPRIIPGDLNGDGDVDLFLSGTQGSFWLERSFLRFGYAQARVERVRVDP